MDVVKILVPLFAGLVGGAALAWRVYVWRHERRSHLTVKATNMLPLFDHGPGDWCFGIEVVNDALAPIEVRSAGFDMNDGSDRQISQMQKPRGATLPGVVRGRSSASTWLELEELERSGLDTYGEIVAWVRTEADETVRSKPTVLRAP